MPDPPINPDITASWQNRLPNDVFAFYQQANQYMLLETGTFTLNADIKWPADKALVVYAENVRLETDINLESRKLSIFCNTLTLGQPVVRLNATGASGQQSIPTDSDPGDKLNGSAGGSLTLYIEKFGDELIPRLDEQGKNLGLYLLAKGGDGSQGVSKTEAGKGGDGGQGGNGGKIDFFFGHEMLDNVIQLDYIIDSSTLPWPAKVAKLLEYKHSSYIDQEAVGNLQKELKTYSVVAKSISDVEARLRELSSADAKEAAKIKQIRSNLLAAITSFLQLTQEPVLTADLSSHVNPAYDALEAIRKSLEPMDEKPWGDYYTSAEALTAALVGIVEKSTDPQVPVGTLRQAYDTFMHSYSGAITDIKDYLKVTYSTEGGKGGAAGSGALPEDSPGATGEPGKEGKTNVDIVWPSEDRANLQIATALALPEECQMVMNRADLEYLTSSISTGYNSARVMYDTISRRLAFAPQLLEYINEKKSSPLLEAYFAMEDSHLGIKMIAQLRDLKDRADLCLRRIAVGEDIFGHPQRWVPRQTYSFYKEKTDANIKQLKALEEQLLKFGSNETPDLGVLASNINQRIAACEDKKVVLTSDNGILKSAAIQIASYTPALKTQRQLITDAIKEVKKDIQAHINMDPEHFLEAMTMVAFAPTPYMAAIQGASIYHKSTTTIKALDGSTVDKSYVVNQFQKIGKGFASLEEGYNNRSNGLIEVDDPGADKLLASKSDIDEMLDKYKKAIDNTRRKALSTQLDLLLDLVKRRNDAVMKYNAGVNMFIQACEELERYRLQLDQIGETILSVNSAIPTGRFWIQKLINDARFAAVESLMLGERALRFWALTRPFQFTKLFEGLPTDVIIDNYSQELQKQFTDCITRYSTNIYSQFPSPIEREKNGQGKCHFLQDREVRGFIDSAKSNSKNEHRIFFTVPLVKSDTSASTSLFAGNWDVRIDQVRVWFFGAVVQPGLDDRRKLSCTLTHLGTESIVRYNGTAGTDEVFDFEHDKLTVGFSYDPLGVVDFASAAACKPDASQTFSNVFRGQAISIVASSLAPVGPFGEWQLTVNPLYNNGLDLSKVTKICIEFWGSAASFDR